MMCTLAKMYVDCYFYGMIRYRATVYAISDTPYTAACDVTVTYAVT